MENKVESSIGLRGSRSLVFSNADNGTMNYKLTNGFEFTASFRPWAYLYAGIVYTNYANTNNGLNSFGHISQSQFGFNAFLATPWTRFQYRNKQLYYRAKIGGVLDATGLEVSRVENSQVNYSFGRLRENRFFASTEFGIKCFGAEGTGMLYLRLSYFRSIYSFSGDSSDLLDFTSGSNDHIVFDIGISL